MNDALISILVLACKEPNVLAYHANLMKNMPFKFIVHVDKKIDIDIFKKATRGCNIDFIDDREDVFWGGFKMIRATVKLAERGLSSGLANRFCLISDDSFPLMGPASLYNSIMASDDIIQCYRADQNNIRRQRYDRFYHFDSNHSSARYVSAEDRYVSPNDLSSYVRLQSLMIRGKRNIDIYTGSQWWMLSRDSLLRCLDVYKNDSWLAESFEFSAIPDEMFFQTLYCESRSRFSGGFVPKVRASVHANFARDPKPFVYQEFSQIDFGEMRDCIFIRKIANNQEIMDRLSGREI
jgi:hypothetical protein